MDKVAINVFAYLVAVILAAPIFAVQVLWEAYVLTHLWAWFVVPRFALDPLSMSAAIGLGCIATLLTTQFMPTGDKSELGKRLLWILMMPTTALVVGWFAK